MAQTGVVCGDRLTDWVSLGVLASWVPRDAVDDAVGVTGKGARRRGAGGVPEGAGGDGQRVRIACGGAGRGGPREREGQRGAGAGPAAVPAAGAGLAADRGPGVLLLPGLVRGC